MPDNVSPETIVWRLGQTATALLDDGPADRVGVDDDAAWAAFALLARFGLARFGEPALAGFGLEPTGLCSRFLFVASIRMEDGSDLSRVGGLR